MKDQSMIVCDGCKAGLMYVSIDYNEERLMAAQVLSVNYNDSTGNPSILHFCSPCMKHEPHKVKDALEYVLHNESEKKVDLAALRASYDDLEKKLETSENNLKKSEAAYKHIKGALEALELKLGKMTADDFSARFREPIFVVLLDEGEDIIRRFLAGPPNHQDEINAFTEKINKWIASAKKTKESTGTHRVLKAGSTLQAAFSGKSQGDKKTQ